MKKKLIIISMIIMMIIPCSVSAKTLQDLKNELANLQSELATNKNNKALTQKEINTLNGEIYKMTKTIENAKIEIREAEISIDESKVKIKEKGKETDEMLKFLQLSSGENVYLEYLFEADSYTDLIYRYAVVKQLTNYNSSLIDELEQLIKDLELKEKTLKEKNIQLEADIKVLNNKVNKLTYNLKSFTEEGSSLEEDIESIKKLINSYEKMGCKLNQELSTCTGTINATGWTYPIYMGCVTSNYGSRSYYLNGRIVNDYHYGIDLSCIPEGTPVYPAADGVVYSIIRRGSCGGNMVYIRHIVNGKRYSTSYLHLLSIANGIDVNTVVTTKTVIGTVGGWSTSSSHGGYDNCTSGTHLHFGVTPEWHDYGFNYYSINPRNILAFPQEGYGYFYK